MSTRALTRRLADLARRQADAAERHAARTATEDSLQARWRAFLGMVPEDLRMPVAVTICHADADESLSSWAAQPFARWAAVPPGFQFPRALVEWLLHPPGSWFLGHACGRCGLHVPLLVTWQNDPDPPPSIVVFPACPACGGTTSWAANWHTEAPRCG